MKIGMVEFGITKYTDRPRVSDYFKFGKMRTNCGCVIFTFSLLYFTILDKDCGDK